MPVPQTTYMSMCQAMAYTARYLSDSHKYAPAFCHKELKRISKNPPDFNKPLPQFCPQLFHGTLKVCGTATASRRTNSTATAPTELTGKILSFI